MGAMLIGFSQARKAALTDFYFVNGVFNRASHCAKLLFDMGQIVIDIPSNAKRRYVLTDSKRAEALLSALDATAVRLKNNPTKLTRQQLEDIRDHEAAVKSIEEMRRTGVSYSVDDLRQEFGLAGDIRLR